ncbi:hypothetical protein D3C81_2313100 [compost metagenome]
MQIAHHAERRFVRDANIADLTGALTLGQSFQGFEQGHHRRAVAPGIAQLAEAVGRALRPVNLI